MFEQDEGENIFKIFFVLRGKLMQRETDSPIQIVICSSTLCTGISM